MPCDVSPLPADLWDELKGYVPEDLARRWTLAVHTRAKALGAAEERGEISSLLDRHAVLNGHGGRVRDAIRKTVEEREDEEEEEGEEEDESSPDLSPVSKSVIDAAGHVHGADGRFISQGEVDEASRELSKGNAGPADELRKRVKPEDAAVLEERLASPGRADPSEATGKVRSQREIGEHEGHEVSRTVAGIEKTILESGHHDHAEIASFIRRATAGQTPKLRRVLQALDGRKLNTQPATKEGLKLRIRELLMHRIVQARDEHHLEKLFGPKPASSAVAQVGKREPWEKPAGFTEAEKEQALADHHAREQVMADHHRPPHADAADWAEYDSAEMHRDRMASWDAVKGSTASADALARAEARLERAKGGALVKALPVLKATHRFASTQILLPGDLSAVLLDFAAQIPDDDLGEDGRESEPHVTVRWGLHGDDAEAVREKLSGLGPVRYRLGKVTVFKGDDYDVVKVDVESPDLHALNSVLGELPHTDTFPDYHPHATIAYVKAGLGEKYAAKFGEVNRDGVADAVIYSDTGKNRSVVPLSLASPAPA